MYWFVELSLFSIDVYGLTCITNLGTCETEGQCYKSVTVYYDDQYILQSYTEYGCMTDVFGLCDGVFHISSLDATDAVTAFACCHYDNCSTDLELVMSDVSDLLPKPPTTMYITPTSTVTPTLSGTLSAVIWMRDSHPTLISPVRSSHPTSQLYQHSVVSWCNQKINRCSFQVAWGERNWIQCWYIAHGLGVNVCTHSPWECDPIARFQT